MFAVCPTGVFKEVWFSEAVSNRRHSWLPGLGPNQHMHSLLAAERKGSVKQQWGKFTKGEFPFSARKPITLIHARISLLVRSLLERCYFWSYSIFLKKSSHFHLLSLKYNWTNIIFSQSSTIRTYSYSTIQENKGFHLPVKKAV